MSKKKTDPLAAVKARFADGWGAWVSCGEGWHSIVTELDAALVAAVPDIRYLQIKEKFADLRVYTTHDGNPDIDALTSAAELRSRETCEVCGAAGTTYMSPRHWYKALCAEHAAEGEYRLAVSP